MSDKLKKCPFCKEKIFSDAIKCKHCGEIIIKKSAERIFEHRISTPLLETHSLGIISFVLAIIGLFSSFLFPFAIQIIGIIIGHIAKNDIKANPGQYSGEGLVTAGLIINYLVILISIITIFVLGIGLMMLLGMA
jgi:hypothetical protein